MALRSLGSSLVAKASPGSRSREAQELRSTKPQVPEKGEPGNISRDQQEEIDVTQVPEGSSKSLRVSPGAETTSFSTPGEGLGDPNDPALLAGTMGMPTASTPGAPTPRGANTQALLRSAQAPGITALPAASRPAQGGKTAKVAASGGPLPNTQKLADRIADYGMTTDVQAESPVQRVGLFNALVNTIGGVQAKADNPQGAFQRLSPAAGSVGGTYKQGNKTIQTPTAGQYLAGAAGKVASSVGNALRSQAVQNVGNKLQSFGGAVTPTVAGKGSISTAANNLRSQASNVVSNLRSQASNALNAVKKLFGR